MFILILKYLVQRCSPIEHYSPFRSGYKKNLFIKKIGMPIFFHATLMTNVSVLGVVSFQFPCRAMFEGLQNWFVLFLKTTKHYTKETFLVIVPHILGWKITWSIIVPGWRTHRCIQSAILAQFLSKKKWYYYCSILGVIIYTFNP